MQYRTGQLDQEVSLQHLTVADDPDGGGGATETWTTYASPWAHIRPMSGRERENAMRNEATSNYMVVIRYRSDVLERDRVVWRGRNLNVRFVRNMGPKPIFLELECELGVRS